MTSDTLFLEAIKTAPDDVATRFAYAGWLEERGDPRGELVRVEEEMRTLAVFADRFWQLKPRRAQLLAGFPKDWLEGMRYGADCPVTITRMPQSVKEWWRLIRVLTERWYQIPCLADVGGWILEIEAVEKQLGRELPESLKELVAFAHDLPPSLIGPDTTDFNHIGTYRIEVLDGAPAISLGWIGNQNLAVRNTDLVNPDPTVFVNYPPGAMVLIPNWPQFTVTQHALFRVFSGVRGLQLNQDFESYFSFKYVDIFEGENLLPFLCTFDNAQCELIHKGFKRMSVPGLKWQQANRAPSPYELSAEVAVN